MAKTSQQVVATEASAGETRAGRLLSLDAFRGLTILAMILVNNPGSWGAMYWPLQHADWHGWTPTDLIFPFFLFIVGTSLAYSLRKYVDPGDSQGAKSRIDGAVYWRIVRRTALLMFLGWFPSLLFRTIEYFNGTATSLDLEHLRLPGVLVRIGIVYFFASMIVLHIPLRGQIVLGIALLLGYWGLLSWLPNPHDYAANLSRDGNVVGLVDRTLIGLNHMYRAGGNTDPEGLLSTLPAIVTSLLGYWTGLFIQRRGVNYKTVAMLAIAGFALAAIGQGWHEVFPINKKIWTSSFVLLTGGLAMVMLAGCLLKFDIWGWRRLARPCVIVGVNAILVFVGSGLLSALLSRWQIDGVSAHDWLLGKITAVLTSPSVASLGWDWTADPKLASLGYALVIVGFWWLVCWVLSRLGWQLKV
jgi:predicted acyltransferase